jgi:hypothetical protein
MAAIAKVLDRLGKVVPRGGRGKPAKQADIAQIESSLNVSLPPDYSEFLRRFGFAIWDGKTVNGCFELDDENWEGYDFDAVRVTQELRAGRTPRKLKALLGRAVVIDDDQAGGYYLLVSTDAERAGQVVYFSEDGEEESWPNFTAFLAERLDE